MELGDYEVNVGFLLGFFGFLLGAAMLLLQASGGLWFFPFVIGLLLIFFSLSKPSKYEQAGGTYEGGIMGSLKKVRDRVCCKEEVG